MMMRVTKPAEWEAKNTSVIPVSIPQVLSALTKYTLVRKPVDQVYSCPPNKDLPQRIQNYHYINIFSLF